MASVDEIIKVLKTIDVRESCIEAAVLTKDKIPPLIKGQLTQGKSGTGRKITPLYKNASYARKKYRMNPVPGYGVPDLYLSGGYYDTLDAKVDPEGITVESDKPYARYVDENYSGEVTKMARDSKEVFIEESYSPALADVIEKQTGLNFKE